MKKKLLLTSILSIVMCVSLIAGATFALFTSESKVNVAVTSGKVDVVATVDENSVWTKRLYDTEYTSGKDRMYEATATFDNEGLTVANMVAGDGIKFDIAVTNNSTVTVKYRTIIACESDNGLFEGFSVTIDGKSYTGATKISDYSVLSVGINGAKIAVAIELPETAGNEYQNKTLKLSFKVEAVQGNAETENPDPNTYYIYTASDLVNLKNVINGYNNAVLCDDINMAGIEYTPFELILEHKTFTFDGDGHTIENFAPTGLTAAAAGNFHHNALIASVDSAYHDENSASTLIFKDLTIEAANVVQEKGDLSIAAALLSEAKGGCNVTVENCEVKNSTFKSDKYAAAFIGYGSNNFEWVTRKIVNCTVDNCQITGNGHTAALMGLENNTLVAQNDTVTNNTIDGNGGHSAAAVLGTGNLAATGIVAANNTYIGAGKCSEDYKDEAYGTFHAYVSYEINGTVYCTSAKLRSVLVPSNGESLSVTLDKNYVLLDDWQTMAFGYYAMGVYIYKNVTMLEIEGNNHSISGLTSVLIANVSNLSLTVKNLKLENANITDSKYNNNLGNAALVGWVQNATVSIENCQVLNSEISDTADCSVTAIVGFVANTATDATFTVGGCTVENVTIKSSSGNGAAIIGHCSTDNSKIASEGYKIEGCIVKNCNITGEKAEKTGAIVGTVNNGGQLIINGCKVSACTTGDLGVALNSIYGRIVDASATLKTYIKIDSTTHGSTGIIG